MSRYLVTIANREYWVFDAATWADAVTKAIYREQNPRWLKTTRDLTIRVRRVEP